MKLSLVKIEEKGRIKVVSPYNGILVSKFRNLRGQFKDGAWFFDDTLEEYVKEALLQVFGYDGTTIPDYCTLKITGFSKSATTDAVLLFGRTIAKAYGRDSGAKLGDDIVLITGDCGSGGSVKNWSTYVSDATLLIKKFFLKRTEFEDIQKAIEAGWCEVIFEKPKRTPEQISDEIAKYQDLIIKLKQELSEV